MFSFSTEVLCQIIKMNVTSREAEFIQPCHLETKQIQLAILTLYLPILSGKIV